MTIAFGIIFIFIIIFFLIFAKTKLFLDIFYGGKIFYKNEKALNLKAIKKRLKKHKQIKIIFDEAKDFIRREKLKVSLIITIFNQEHFLVYPYSFIQYQNLKDLEIIILDDASQDNSWKIIKNLIKKDKRIIYLKNKNNKGSFYSRNIGDMLSRGEYILVIDPDDLLLNNILLKAYIIAKYYNLDILQYYIIKGSYKDNKIWRKNKYESGILYKDKVKEVFFYSVTRTLWDKLFHSLFVTFKYYYIQTKENKEEKNYVGYTFFYDKVYKYYKNRTQELTKGIHYIINVLDMYINCSFFNNTQKIYYLFYQGYLIIRKNLQKYNISLSQIIIIKILYIIY